MYEIAPRKVTEYLHWLRSQTGERDDAEAMLQELGLQVSIAEVRRIISMARGSD